MRQAFADALLAAAATDPDLWLIVGDVGYSVVEPFAARFASRFVNAGVAEQNMLGLAAGLAIAGKNVFVYSLANFPTFRCYEQLRNDIAYHRLNVTVVAVGGGLAYGGHGYSHHAVEDLGAVRLLPHTTVIAPGDPHEAAWATRELARHVGPAYLRLGRGHEPAVHDAESSTWQIGQPILVRQGAGCTIASTGGMLALARQAAEQLDATLYSVPTLAPLDWSAVLDSARGTTLVTVEDHGPGGLGTLAAEAIVEREAAVRLRPVRFAATPIEVAGSQEYLNRRHGVDLAGILAAARS